MLFYGENVPRGCSGLGVCLLMNKRGEKVIKKF